MTTRELHPSRLDLFAACSASLVPAVAPWNPGSPEAALGTAMHEGLAERIAGHTISVSDLAQKYSVDTQDLNTLVSLGWDLWSRDLSGAFPDPALEIGLEYQAALGVKLKGRLDLYSVLHGQANGSLFAGQQPVEARALDWKSGWNDAADHGEQMRAYAFLLAHRFPSLQKITTVLVWVRSGEIDTVVHTREELDRWWLALNQRLQRAPAYAPGQHCQYCPRALECPARAAMFQQTSVALLAGNATEFLERMLASSDSRREYLDRLQSQILKALPRDPESRGAVLGQIHRRRKMLEAVLEMVKSLERVELGIAGGTLPAGDGQELHLAQRTSTHIDAKSAWPVLSEAMTQDEILGCVDVRKTRLEKTVRDREARGQKQQKGDELMALLDLRGALQTEKQTIVQLRRKTLPVIESTGVSA